MKSSENVKATAEAAKKTVKKAATKAKKVAEPVVEELVKAAEPVVEETVKAVKKTTRRKKVVENVYLQYLGKEISQADVVAKAKEACGVDEKEIKTVTVYLKPEENKAYYLVNDTVSGSIEL